MKDYKNREINKQREINKKRLDENDFIVFLKFIFIIFMLLEWQNCVKKHCQPSI